MNNANRLETWVQIVADPHAGLRGFSILGREFKVEGHSPVQGEMEDFNGKRMQGMFWVVEEDEFFRVCPEFIRRGGKNKPWFLPQEFCKGFVRPYYFRRTKIVDIKLTPPDDPPKKNQGIILTDKD